MQSRATKVRSGQPKKGSQYIQHIRNIAQMQVEQRNQRMNAKYQNVRKVMRGNMPKGVAQNGFKRAALENNRLNGNPMANMGQTNKPNTTGARVQRDGSQMDINGQRAPSPSSNETAPSPKKRPRVEGAINNNLRNTRSGEFAQQADTEQQKNREEYAQSLAQGHRVSLSNAASLHAMTSGEPSIAQRITLEQQNHKRLLIASQEQDSISGPHQQGQGQFPPAVSPFGTRSGLSPNPKETKSRKPKLGHQEQPGSPMPDSIMQQQRGSPAPNMNFTDPILAPPGALPFYQHLPPDMKPPPISYPIANFGGQQPTPQQVEAMRNGQKNGQRRGVPPQPGMSLQMMQEMLLQRKEMAREVNPMMQHQTPAHPAPARRRGHNRSHGPSNQALPKPNPAPPTPDQTSETAPRNKGTKGKKKPPESNASNASAAKRRVEPTISRDYSSRDNKQLRSRFMALQKRHGV